MLDSMDDGIIDPLIQDVGDLSTAASKQDSMEVVGEWDEIHGEKPDVLRLHGATREEVMAALDSDNSSARHFRGGVDVSWLRCPLDADLVECLLEFCGSSASAKTANGVALRMGHVDLGSGTTREQRIFDLKAERLLKDKENAFWLARKKESSKQKDFPAAAKMRREGEEGIAATSERISGIDAELAELDIEIQAAPWYALVSCLGRPKGSNGVDLLDLTDCGLHATGIAALTLAILELDHRGDGRRITHLVLDGNDLGDRAMGSMASFLRLSSHLEVLSMRNVGITEQGVSEIVSGLFRNKTLALLDLRDNGLSAPAVGQEVVTGVRRLNSSVAEILL
eukprot:TRINITY_DN50868_c0_g1_i1.p1 TRINITY_DN50868_c0_g1~~TRINITY_DN50868_c0_g1_i1.p1  ORF type:complete len:339 (+),score=70.34 TRINITY_DN50868_c0_g1_i1:75-1091(+)